MFESAVLPAADALHAAPDAALIDLLTALDRERSRLDALSIRTVAELHGRRLAEHHGRAPFDGEAADPVELTADQVLTTELTAALRISDTSAQHRIHQARVLTEDLPATLDAYARGDLHLGQVKAVQRTSDLLTERVINADGSDGDPLYTGDALRQARADLEKTVLAGDQPLTHGRLRYRLRRALETLAPKHTLRTKLARETAQFIRFEPCDDGVNAHVTGLLPMARALVLDAQLTAYADAANPTNPRGIDDEGRSHAARRVHAFLDLAHTGRTRDCATNDPAPAVQVHVTVAATTLIGLDDEPADLVTPTLTTTIPADIARDLAEDATWRRILTDPTGAVVDVGTRTYRPSTRIGREVRAKNPTCVFPGCAKPALHCDLDHVIPFAQGGETTVENLAPECRFHHRVKTHTRWQVKPLPGGRGWRWTAPTGHTYDTTTAPPPY